MRQRQYKQKIYTVATECGELLTQYDQVINHFHDYYVRLLGTADVPEQLINAEVMAEGPTLTVQQQLMLIRNVTPEEIKTVV